MKKTLFLLFINVLCYAQPKGMKPVGGTAPAGTERRLALVVGNKTYQYIGKLINPHNDADDMAATLERLGFEVIIRKDLAQSDFLRAIDDFGRRLSQYDVGLFYYSGHGLQFNGENYLVPTDANAQTPPEIEYSCVKLGRTLAKMEGANLKVSLALLDACRDNPFPAATRTAVAKGLAIPNNPPGSFVAYSTRAGSTADDNATARNGLFTSELLRHLSTPNTGIRGILDRTTQGVRTRSNGQQIPGRYDELTGDFVFVQTTAPQPPAVEPKKEPRPPTPDGGVDLEPIAMRYVEGGSFEMGSNEYDDEKPIHKVTVSSFWMATTETTVGQYRLYCEATGTPMPTEPSWGWQESHPIVNVNWNDAVAYCEWLSHKTGRTYRLPTEAEWEYAARGGQQSRRTTYAGSNVLDEVGWYTSNTQDKGTKAVGQKRANELGLHDLSGNVWEWCSDWYDQTYYANSSSSNPTGPATGSYRVLRGGSWLINPANNRVAIRCHGTPSYRYIYVGFRVVCLQ